MGGCNIVEAQYSSYKQCICLLRTLATHWNKDVLLYIWRIVRAGGCPVVVAQWQSTVCTSQAGFDSR